MNTGCALLAVLAGAAHADAAALLGEYNESAVFGFAGVAHSAVHSTFLSPLPGVFSGEGTLFEEIRLTSGTRRVERVLPGGDPDLARYVELVTDGRNWFVYDLLAFDDGSKRGAFGLESDRLPPGTRPWPPGHRHPDLFNRTVEYVEREISIVIDTPGRDPNQNGVWTDVEVEVVTRIYGQVPAPGAAAVLAWLPARRRRRPDLRATAGAREPA